MPRRGSALVASTSCADRVLAVAGDAGRDALGDRRELAADDEDAVVVAGDEALDDDVAAPGLARRDVEGGPDLVLGPQVEGDAPAVVAVERLEHARIADPLGGRDRLVLRLDHLGAGHRQARRIEQAVGELLVGRDVDRDAARPRGHRRPDPLLVNPLPQLDQAEPVEPDVRDVAPRGLVEQRLRRRPERQPLGEPDELLHLGHQVERDGRVARRDEVVDEPDGRLAGLDPDLLLAVLEDHVVAAVLAGAARLAVADVGAGEVLELERDVLGHVPDPGALAKPRDEPAAPAERAGVVLERRQHPDQGVDEARDLVARELLEHAEVDDLADDRLARPVVGAAQDAGLDDPEAGLGARAAGLVGGAPAGGGRLAIACRVGGRRPCSSPGSRVRLRHVASSRVRCWVPECTRQGCPTSPVARGCASP